MPARRVTCIVIACDVCGCVLDDEDECVMHFATEDDARATARRLYWPVTTGPWVCTADDADHTAAIDALLPPAPQPVCDGQTTLIPEEPK